MERVQTAGAQVPSLMKMKIILAIKSHREHNRARRYLLTLDVCFSRYTEERTTPPPLLLWRRGEVRLLVAPATSPDFSWGERTMVGGSGAITLIG